MKDRNDRADCKRKLPLPSILPIDTLKSSSKSKGFYFSFTSDKTLFDKTIESLDHYFVERVISAEAMFNANKRHTLIKNEMIEFKRPADNEEVAMVIVLIMVYNQKV